MSVEAMPKEIAEAVILMMVKVGYVQKKGKNEFHNYKYASIEGVLEKVQPALAECGLVITQDELSHGVIADGQLMEANYAFTLTHKSGVQSSVIRHTGLAAVRNSKGGYDDKSLNKCHTAARKYFILSLFQIPTGLADDPDEQEDQPDERPAPKVAPARTAAPQSKTAKSPAEEWAGNQSIFIRTLSMERITDWEKKNESTMNRLKGADPKAFEALETVIADRRAELRNFGIAAE